MLSVHDQVATTTTVSPAGDAELHHDVKGSIGTPPGASIHDLRLEAAIERSRGGLNRADLSPEGTSSAAVELPGANQLIISESTDTRSLSEQVTQNKNALRARLVAAGTDPGVVSDALAHTDRHSTAAQGSSSSSYVSRDHHAEALANPEAITQPIDQEQKVAQPIASGIAEADPEMLSHMDTLAQRIDQDQPDAIVTAQEIGGERANDIEDPLGMLNSQAESVEVSHSNALAASKGIEQAERLDLGAANEVAVSTPVAEVNVEAEPQAISTAPTVELKLTQPEPQTELRLDADIEAPVAQSAEQPGLQEALGVAATVSAAAELSERTFKIGGDRENGAEERQGSARFRYFSAMAA